MNENDFLSGLRGEEHQSSDLVQGAEHLVRLKQQTGYQQDRDADLELRKEAGPVDSLKTGIKKAIERVGPHVKNFGQGVKEGVKWQGMGAKGAVHNLKNSRKAVGSGQILGQALPGMAVGAGATALAMKEKKAADGNRLIEALKTIDPSILTSMGIGAGVAGAGTYLASRPQENGKSRAEESLETSVKNDEEKPSNGLFGKMHQANTKLMHGYAQAFRDHPVKAGLMGVATGAGAGYGLSRLAGSNKPSIEAIKAALRGGK